MTMPAYSGVITCKASATLAMQAAPTPSGFTGLSADARYLLGGQHHDQKQMHPHSNCHLANCTLYSQCSGYLSGQLLMVPSSRLSLGDRAGNAHVHQFCLHLTVHPLLCFSVRLLCTLSFLLRCLPLRCHRCSEPLGQVNHLCSFGHQATQVFKGLL